MVSIFKFSGRSVPRRLDSINKARAFSLVMTEPFMVSLSNPADRLFKMVLRGCWKRMPTVS